MDYTPKQLTFGDEGREKLISGVEKLARAVKSTLGPSGNTVLIESQHHTSGMTVTKDGVTVAKSIDLIDPIENLAVRIMKQAADRTATNAGDGTTTAIVLTEAIVLSVLRQMEEKSEVISMIEVTRELDRVCDSIIASLDGMSKKVTKARLLDVATISANNDTRIGKIIADTYTKAGLKNGVVTVSRSQTTETWAEVIDGIRVDKGYSSPMFINDHKRDECILEDTAVLVADMEISNFLNIEAILRPVLQQKKKLLIIAPCSKQVINTLAANVVKNGLKVCAIDPPSFGFRQHELMSDIALSLGATYFSEKTGDDLSIITEDDLGFASKIVASKTSTIIIRAHDADKLPVEQRVAELWEQHAQTENASEKTFVLDRIASLSGGVGVIHVGGTTDMEQKERYDRVDDAVCAVRSALADGIVSGGGVALASIAVGMEDGTVAKNAMVEALLTPMRQIMINAGLPAKTFYDNRSHALNGVGMNVKTGEVGNMLTMGVIDPTKVTKEAVKNAVSVASTILSTNAIVTLARTYDDK
jgi:chaperonin GroEL